MTTTGNLEQKLEVCRLVERDESLRKIADSFVMGLFTVSDFYRSRRQLTDFVPQNLQLRYDLDFVYNTDETDLIWKCLPKASLASMTEKTASGFKSCKERMTLLCFANATGSDRLQLLLVGKSQRPRTIIGILNDRRYFFRWYDEIFIPHVKKYQKTKRLVLFFPPNTSSLIQPMDQAVIQSLKKRYRKELLRRIIFSKPDGSDLASQLKSINLKDCCYMPAQVWESISGNTLRVLWNKLLGYNEDCMMTRPRILPWLSAVFYYAANFTKIQEIIGCFEKEESAAVKIVCEIMQKESLRCDLNFLVPKNPGSNVDIPTVIEMFQKFKLSWDEVEQWLGDDYTPLFEALTDDEVLEAVEKDEDEDGDESDMSDKPNERLCHSEAYSSFKFGLKWMEQQKEFSAAQLMVVRHSRCRCTEEAIFVKTESYC
ncbi:Jerky -like protein-like [Trichinella nelsoni]|uniref:Jerky-like protein-like n=1 Tax=Trichinella nelsoni TaxID=6336 RepID=A0A0V0RVK8_9BILA|nr:Jerky -like protein-like [Trichinella nelsoni]